MNKVVELNNNEIKAVSGSSAGSYVWGKVQDAGTYIKENPVHCAITGLLTIATGVLTYLFMRNKNNIAGEPAVPALSAATAATAIVGSSSAASILSQTSGAVVSSPASASSSSSASAALTASTASK